MADPTAYRELQRSFGQGESITMGKPVRVLALLIGVLLSLECGRVSGPAAFAAGSGTAKGEGVESTKQKASESPEKAPDASERRKRLEAQLETTKGTIVLELLSKDAPITVANFVNLANRKYYDGVVFHRVIADFMIQGGDPTGTGRGGPGYRFEDEFESGRKFDRPGILAMANAGPGTNGSQFFITHVPTPHLNNKHTIFGLVKEGQEIVDSIARGDKIVALKIVGDATELLEKQKDRIAKWNAIMDSK